MLGCTKSNPNTRHGKTPILTRQETRVLLHSTDTDPRVGVVLAHRSDTGAVQGQAFEG